MRNFSYLKVRVPSQHLRQKSFTAQITLEHLLNACKVQTTPARLWSLAGTVIKVSPKPFHHSPPTCITCSGFIASVVYRQAATHRRRSSESRRCVPRTPRCTFSAFPHLRRGSASCHGQHFQLATAGVLLSFFLFPLLHVRMVSLTIKGLGDGNRYSH